MKIKIILFLIFWVPMFISCDVAKIRYGEDRYVTRHSSKSDELSYVSSKKKKETEKQIYKENQNDERSQILVLSSNEEVDTHVESLNSQIISSDFVKDDEGETVQARTEVVLNPNLSPSDANSIVSFSDSDDELEDLEELLTERITLASFIVAILAIVIPSAAFLAGIVTPGFGALGVIILGMILGGVLGLTALILGILGLKRQPKKRWMAILGIVVGAIITLFITVWTIVILVQ